MSFIEKREIVLALLEDHPEGLGFNDICRKAEGSVSRRTVKKALDTLIALGYVVKEGGGGKWERVCYKAKKSADEFKRDMEKLDQAYARSASSHLRMIEKIKEASKGGEQYADRLKEEAPHLFHFAEGLGDLFRLILFVGMKYGREARLKLMTEYLERVNQALDQLSFLFEDPLQRKEFRQLIDKALKRRTAKTDNKARACIR